MGGWSALSVVVHVSQLVLFPHLNSRFDRFLCCVADGPYDPVRVTMTHEGEIRELGRAAPLGDFAPAGT